MEKDTAVKNLVGFLDALVKNGTQLPTKFPVLVQDVFGNFHLVYSKHHYYNSGAKAWFEPGDVFDTLAPFEAE